MVREKREYQQVDVNSNYRLYYQNDHSFYLSVMDGEPSPYFFKVLIFVDLVKHGNQVDVDEEKMNEVLQNSDVQILYLLESDYEAMDVKSSRTGNKLRVNFSIGD